MLSLLHTLILKRHLRMQSTHSQEFLGHTSVAWALLILRACCKHYSMRDSTREYLIWINWTFGILVANYRYFWGTRHQNADNYSIFLYLWILFHGYWLFHLSLPLQYQACNRKRSRHAIGSEDFQESRSIWYWIPNVNIYG